MSKQKQKLRHLWWQAPLYAFGVFWWFKFVAHALAVNPGDKVGHGSRSDVDRRGVKLRHFAPDANELKAGRCILWNSTGVCGGRAMSMG